MKSQILSALCAVAVVGLLTTGLQAGEEPTEQHRIKVVLAADGGEPDVIEVDNLELEVGESHQFLTDSGKEVVITRTEDGLNLTVDGEEIDMPAIHGRHGVAFSHDTHKIVERIVTSHDGEEHGNSMVFVTSGDGDVDVETQVHKMVVGHGGANAVFISEDGEATAVKGHHVMNWTGHSPTVEINGAGLTEHLQETGALDELSDEQRQKVLDAIASYKSSPRVMVIEVDTEVEGEEH